MSKNIYRQRFLGSKPRLKNVRMQGITNVQLRANEGKAMTDSKNRYYKYFESVLYRVDER